MYATKLVAIIETSKQANVKQMSEVLISKTVYTIVKTQEDDKAIYHSIQKGNTQKGLFFRKRSKKWELWSCQNGLDSVGSPKLCDPTFLEADAVEEKPVRKKTTTKTPQIKKDLKAAFPGVKFSVRCESSTYYTVKWENGLTEGATLKAVKEVTAKYHTQRNISQDLDPIFSGDVIWHTHLITDSAWKQTVVEAVAKKYSDEYFFDKTLERFTFNGVDNPSQCHWINKDYSDILHNGFEPVTETEEKEPVTEVKEAEEETEPNWYEEKQARRQEYYLSQAEKCDRESDKFYQDSHEATEHIPLGQPILVGHHSESSHRRALAKSWDKMGKSVEATKKANYYREKAESVGEGGISSDDPDAIAKLTKQLEAAKESQEEMKEVNKFVRKNDRKGLREIGYTEAQIETFFLPDFAGRVGFPSYKLSNNLANIKRIEKRIAELNRSKQIKYKKIERESLNYIQDPEINRVQLIFDGKPSVEIREILKSNGFRWAPSNLAWQRKLNHAAIRAAESAVIAIEQL